MRAEQQNSNTLRNTGKAHRCTASAISALAHSICTAVCIIIIYVQTNEWMNAQIGQVSTFWRGLQRMRSRWRLPHTARTFAHCAGTESDCIGGPWDTDGRNVQSVVVRRWERRMPGRKRREKERAKERQRASAAVAPASLPLLLRPSNSNSTDESFKTHDCLAITGSASLGRNLRSAHQRGKQHCTVLWSTFEHASPTGRLNRRKKILFCT